MGYVGFLCASAVSLILYIGFQCIRLFVSEESRDLLVQLASSSFMEVTLSYFSYILIFAISDYFSLLLVRNRLFTWSGDPIVNLLWVFIFGVALVFISYMILLIITYGVDRLTLQFYSNMTIAQLIKREFIQFFYHTRYFVGLIPPLLVHLWLLLFVIGSVGLRIIVLFLHATAGVQRIMGHPIRAIGMVAMIPVFFVGTRLGGPIRLEGWSRGPGLANLPGLMKIKIWYPYPDLACDQGMGRFYITSICDSRVDTARRVRYWVVLLRL